MSFNLPSLYINPPFSWGPPAEELTIDGQPFQLYFKESGLSAVDWKRTNDDVDDDGGQHHGGGRNFISIEDSTRVRALENERAKRRKPTFKRNTTKFNRNRQTRARRITDLQSTFSVRFTTVIFAEFDQHEMPKLRIAKPPLVTDIMRAGLPRVYDTAMDKVTAKTPRLIDESEYKSSYFYRKSLAEDPNIREIAGQIRGRLVIVTDEVLSLLMTGNLTMHPWHVEATRFNNILFVDKDERHEGVGNVDRQWVSETASREIAPSEDAEDSSLRISSLGDESTKVHDCFVRASCRPKLAQMSTSRNPFREQQPRLYTYRRFTLNAGTADEYSVIVRCETDAVTDEGHLLRIFGLLEQPNPTGTSEWMRAMTTGRPNELPRAFEMNRGKMGRWIAQANLSNAAFMKIGFVTRAKKADSVAGDYTHQVLSVQTEAPQSLAAQFGINILTLWAIADHLFTAAFKSSEGKERVMIVKPSGEGRVVICEDAEDSDDEEEEDDDDDDDDE